MSYDLHLLHVSTGDNAANVPDRRIERQVQRLNPGPPSASLEEER